MAHAFDNLQTITTINTYVLFLPDPNKWLNEETEWNFENDVINLPMTADENTVGGFEINPHAASDVFYGLISEKQKQSLPLITHEYPFTQDFVLDDGETVRLLLRKRRPQEDIPEWTPISNIFGAGWARNYVLYSGEYSGFVPFLSHRPFYVVDHGTSPYSHDAFGIHLGQVDHLTFSGTEDSIVRIELVDCRVNSPSFKERCTFAFHPDAKKCLVIPNGVAYRFENLQSVFTLNQPKVFLPRAGDYQPGNDVIDWPLGQDEIPELMVNDVEAGPEFYWQQVNAQLELLRTPSDQSTPIVLMALDDKGNQVRVALRKREELDPKAVVST